MDAATLTAVGTIVVGLAAAAGAIIGKRGETRASQSGTLIGGYSTLVDQVQEERDKAQAKLAENEAKLTEAYRELAAERADQAGLHRQIAELTVENDRLHARIAELGGTTL